MGYYMAGDYYAAGGIFGTLGSIAKKAIGIGSKIIPGPVGAGLGVISGAIGGGGATRPAQLQPLPPSPTLVPMQVGPTIVPTPGIVGFAQRVAPGGATGYSVVTGKKRRRMNVGNAKALRRAIRREQGFVKLARRALKGTGYAVTSRSASRRRAVSVRETGPGSVTVR